MWVARAKCNERFSLAGALVIEADGSGGGLADLVGGYVGG